MSSESDELSSGAEDRMRKYASAASAASAAAASPSPPPQAAPSAKKIRVGKLNSAFNPAAFTLDPPENGVSDLVSSGVLSASSIPAMKSIGELLKDCQFLGQNIDGSPVCAEQQARLLAKPPRGSPTGKRKIDQVEKGSAAAAAAAPGASAAASSSPAVAATGPEVAVTYEDDLSQALLDMNIIRNPDQQGHWVKDEFDRLLENLEVPEFYHYSNISSAPLKVQQEELVKMLENRQLVLLTQPASLESSLLAEAGIYLSNKTGKEYNFPPCRNGKKCVGMTHFVYGQTRPFIYTMTFMEYEYEAFLLHRIPPRVSRPCVQCCRHHIVAQTIYDRHVRSCGQSQQGDSVLGVSKKGEHLWQFYNNRVDVKDGYHSRYMFLPTHTPGDPLLEPICRPNTLLLFCTLSKTFKHKETGQPRILVNQDQLIWQAPSIPEPTVGQNLFNFYGGAKH